MPGDSELTLATLVKSLVWLVKSHKNPVTQLGTWQDHFGKQVTPLGT
jgi:hypothetical protein